MSFSPIEEIKNRLDIVEVIGSYIKLQKAGVNFRALCPFHSEKKPSFFVSPSRQIWHCFGGCLPAGSLIKTNMGYHNVEQMKIGQRVLTHKGRFRPVLKTFQRPYKGEMVDIRVRKSSEVVSLTGDHKVFVIKTKNCKQKARETRICQPHCQQRCPTKYFLDYKIEKVPARNISLNDFLLFPIDKKIVDVNSINLDNYLTRTISSHDRRSKKLPKSVVVNEGFLKLLGYWIAEGSTDKYGHLIFSLGDHEKRFTSDIRILLKNIFGLDSTIYKKKKIHYRGIDIRINSSNLANIFENLCGKGAQNKHIPFEFQNLPLEKQRIILESVFRGDGNVGKVPKTITKRYFKAIGTISPILAEQLRDILLRLGIVPTITVQEARIDKKGVSHKISYTIHWQEDIKLHFADISKINNISYALFPVKEIKKRKFQGEVYNFTVDEDHSYVAENFVVSNCGEGGDIFKFVMKIEGVEFGDALRILAQKAGVELKRQAPQYKQWQTERQRLYEICELATRFFEKQLEESKAGKEAKKYLLNRGISEDSIKKWRLGYSPDSWQGLSDFLVGKGYKKEETERAGLSIKSDQGSFYDRFRGRIIFPIFDLNSQVVGFGGRVFKEKDKAEVAKYVNTPNTLLYDKSRILYGLDKAKVEIRKKNTSILVEGYTDVIMAYQAGTQNIVATSGTALTSYQLKVIKRYSENLILGFDMDLAGDSATKRGIDLAQSLGFSLKVTRLPEGKDAADIILKNPKEWQVALENPKSILEFYFQSAFSGRNPETPEGKKEISKILLPALKRIPNEIERSYWIQRLAGELKVKEENVGEELKKVKTEEEIYGLEPEEQINLPSKPRKELLEERLLTMLLKFPQHLNLIEENKNLFISPKGREILINLKDNSKNFSAEVKEDKSSSSTELLQEAKVKKKAEPSSPPFVAAREVEEYFNYLALKAEIEEVAETSSYFSPQAATRPSAIAEKEILAEIQFCLKELQSLEIKNRLDKISQEIKKAESEKNPGKIKKLTEEFSQLSKEIDL